eukprot:4266141-Pleurochrysis_carterae.AAC.1
MSLTAFNQYKSELASAPSFALLQHRYGVLAAVGRQDVAKILVQLLDEGKRYVVNLTGAARDGLLRLVYLTLHLVADLFFPDGDGYAHAQRLLPARNQMSADAMLAEMRRRIAHLVPAETSSIN